MVFTPNIWVVLFACGFAMGVFLTILLLSSAHKYSIHTQNLTVVILILSLLLFSELAEESNLVDSIPTLLTLSPTLDLLIWPFLVFYIQYLSGFRNEYRLKDLLLFIPFILALLWQVPFQMMSDEAKLAFFKEGIPWQILTLVSYKLICTILFIGYLLRILSSAITNYGKVFSTNRKVRFLGMVKRFMTIISVLILTIYSLFFVGYFQLFNIGDSDRIGGLIISFIIYLLAALIYKTPHLFLLESYSKQVVNALKGKESQYIESLIDLFENAKVYTNEKLTVKEVAITLSITEQQLSYLVNRQLGISFLDFINTYRVNDVINRLNEGEHKDKTLLGIALDAGFNSKATFNRNFKELTGSTPSDFMSRENIVSNTN